MLDEEKGELWSQVATDTKDIIKLSSEEGIIGACVTSGELINIADAYQDNRFNSKHDKQASFHTKSVLAMPIKNEEGKVIGGIQMINKKQKDGNKVIDFTKDDERLATMMAAHVTSFVSIIG